MLRLINEVTKHVFFIIVALTKVDFELTQTQTNAAESDVKNNSGS